MALGFTQALKDVSARKRLRLKPSSPSVSRLSIQFEIFDIPQPYRIPRPITEIDLLFYSWIMFLPHRKHTYGPPRPTARMTLLLLLFHMLTAWLSSLGTSNRSFLDRSNEDVILCTFYTVIFHPI
jgi:hypothetical protein